MKKSVIMLAFVPMLLILCASHSFATNSTEISSMTLNVLKEIDGIHKSKSNQIFRNVKVSGGKGRYTVQGEASPHGNHFFYMIEDGHNILVSEQKVSCKEGFPKWSNFVIKEEVESERLPENGTVVMYLYERGQGGTMVFVYPVILVRFY